VSIPGTRLAVAWCSLKEIDLVVLNGSGVADWQFFPDTLLCLV
jgi:hypothetical protein